MIRRTVHLDILLRLHGLPVLVMNLSEDVTPSLSGFVRNSLLRSGS